MTDLSTPVRRRVIMKYKGYAPAAYVVELSLDGIRYRKAKSRTWFGPVPHQTTLDKAVLMAVMAERRSKKERKGR